MSRYLLEIVVDIAKHMVALKRRVKRLSELDDAMKWSKYNDRTTGLTTAERMNLFIAMSTPCIVYKNICVIKAAD